MILFLLLQYFVTENIFTLDKEVRIRPYYDKNKSLVYDLESNNFKFLTLDQTILDNKKDMVILDSLAKYFTIKIGDKKFCRNKINTGSMVCAENNLSDFAWFLENVESDKYVIVNKKTETGPDPDTFYCLYYDEKNKGEVKYEICDKTKSNQLFYIQKYSEGGIGSGRSQTNQAAQVSPTTEEENPFKKLQSPSNEPPFNSQKESSNQRNIYPDELIDGKFKSRLESSETKTIFEKSTSTPKPVEPQIIKQDQTQFVHTTVTEFVERTNTLWSTQTITNLELKTSTVVSVDERFVTHFNTTTEFQTKTISIKDEEPKIEPRNENLDTENKNSPKKPSEVTSVCKELQKIINNGVASTVHITETDTKTKEVTFTKTVTVSNSITITERYGKINEPSSEVKDVNEKEKPVNSTVDKQSLIPKPQPQKPENDFCCPKNMMLNDCDDVSDIDLEELEAPLKDNSFQNSISNILNVKKNPFSRLGLIQKNCEKNKKKDNSYYMNLLGSLMKKPKHKKSRASKANGSDFINSESLPLNIFEK